MTGRFVQAVEYGGYCTAATALLTFGFVSGLDIDSFTVEVLSWTLNVVFVDAVSSALGFTLFGTVTGVLLLREVTASRTTPSHEGPPATAIVPVYRDANALSNSV